MNRLILLASANSYRTGDFEKAASRLGIEVVLGMDVPAPLAHTYNCSLPLDYLDLKRSSRAIVKYAEENPVRAILSADDSATVLAAEASQRLNLPHNDPAAAEAARDKYVMRQMFAKAGVPSPQVERFLLRDDVMGISTQINTDDTQMHADDSNDDLKKLSVHTGSEKSNQKNQPLSAFNQRPLRSPATRPLTYPVVVKPRYLSGSRGVIRANNPDEFVAAVERIQPIIERAGGDDYLVENFIPGVEVALEGLLDNGTLKVLALFDKPDPLDGPFFEETIYVTPSRLPAATQQAIFDAASHAAAALGLRNGPLHAELRVNDQGPWLVELAGRSIGGLCSRTLRFGTDMALEELILRQAFGMEIESTARESVAGGVMMIPIPKAGVFVRCEGVEAAEAVSGVESIEITAKPNYSIYPLPEGDSYLGFIFARGETPEDVETALREAHERLRFEIAEEIVVLG